MNQTEKEAFETWLKTRPPAVQKLARDYPPGWYRVKDGAPYGVSTPDTLVKLYAYTESGLVGVIVFARHKTPDAIDHEALLSQRYGSPPIHDKDILVHVEPEWLTWCGETEEECLQ